MNRLTKKIEEFKVYTLSDAFISEIPDVIYGKKYCGEAINKLGKLEDLEEELGCPLEIVITPYYKRGKLEVLYREKMREVIRVVAFEEATRPYMEVWYRDDEKSNFKAKTIWLDDYKKTWWLKPDKSE